MKRYYFAYGSNLNLREMKKRCWRSELIGSAILKDYQLVYRGVADEYAYLTIEPCEGSYVPVGLFDISLFDELRLDAYEGYPDLYEKKYVSVEFNGKKITGLVYVMRNEFSYHKPSLYYVDTCEQGYKDFNFDKSILDKALKISVENSPKELKRS